MRKYKTHKKLIELFSQFKYHPDILDEIMELVVEKGKTNQFVKILQKNIKIIDTLKLEVTKLKNFEKLQNANDLYSMKFKGTDMNIRILYSYDGDAYTLLLCCFEEKEDSNVNSYKRYIPIAQKRRQEMEDKNEN